MNTDDCIFCKIGARELDADVVHESSEVIAFRDINPAAPTHVLVIPKRHVRDATELDDGDLLEKIFIAITAVARAAGLDGGFRIVNNVGSDGGQTVDHVHFHVLGGRGMAWPPG